MRSASLRFGISGSSIEVEVVRNVAALRSASIPTPSPETSFTTMASAPLRSSLARPFSNRVLSLCRETDDELAGPSLPRNFGEDVFGRREFERDRPGALQLLVGNAHRAIVSNCCGLDDKSGSPMRSSTALRISSAVVTLHQFATRRRMKCRRPANENDLCSAALRGIGQGVAHLAAGAIAEIANRVESLARAARSDKHDLAGEIVATAQRIEHHVGNRVGLGHASAPTMPQARSPVPGSMTRTPRWRRISRFAWVAGCCHMFTFIAGATSTGAVVARYMVVRKSSAIP